MRACQQAKTKVKKPKQTFFLKKQEKLQNSILRQLVCLIYFTDLYFFAKHRCEGSKIKSTKKM
jgi:acyl-CoA thioesterase